MRILVTGAYGFIGRNLRVRLDERGGCAIFQIGREDGAEALASAAASADMVFHLAGVNRPDDEAEFAAGNRGFTEQLCAALAEAKSRAPIIYASSAKATLDNAYGRSKREAEDALIAHAEATRAPLRIYRLPNVFGKWARPNYNSAVATFCHNIARGLDIEVHDPAARLDLVYIDDVIGSFLRLLDTPLEGGRFGSIEPVYPTTVGAVADIIRSFAGSRSNLITPPVGTGLVRALYATYVSFLPVEAFEYRVPIHADPRGAFIEMLKTQDSGQFAYFTAGPGVTRGEHYHHSKVEKFLVLSGKARFGYRNILTGETYKIEVQGGEGRIVESIPGWTHNVTNIGDSELIVMLWASEIFDRAHPDTVAMKV